MASRDLHEAEDGLGARLAGDATLAALLSSDESGAVRIYAGWPEEVLQQPSAPEFPRVSIFRVVDDIERPELGVVRLQVDIWVWPEGASGGVARLQAIDSRILELVDEAAWTHGQARLRGAVVPGGTDDLRRPLRRRRDFEIAVS